MTLVVAAMTVLTNAAGALAEGPPAGETTPNRRHHPVWYGTRLAISSVDQLAERLRAPFAEGVAHPAEVTTCEQLLQRCRADNPGACAEKNASERDLQAAKATLADCLVLDELRRARPAAVSYLARTRWDRRWLAQLPPGLAINASAEAARKTERAAARGKTWRELDRTIKGADDGDDRIKVTGDGFVQVLLLWGRGDFDDDGAEDLLVQSLDTLTEGTYRNTRIFILSRRTAGARLRLSRTLL